MERLHERRKTPRTPAQKTSFWCGKILRYFSVTFVLGVLVASVVTAHHKVVVVPTYAMPATAYQHASHTKPR